MSIPNGFWGLTVEPNKEYSETVEDGFEVNMAALDEKIRSDKRCTLNVTVEDHTFVLCSLIPNKIEQQPMTLRFTPGQDITFKSTGDTPIHLTGSYMDSAYDEDPYGFDDEDDEDDDEEDIDNLDSIMNGEDSDDLELDDDESDAEDDDDNEETKKNKMEGEEIEIVTPGAKKLAKAIEKEKKKGEKSEKQEKQQTTPNTNGNQTKKRPNEKSTPEQVSKKSKQEEKKEKSISNGKKNEKKEGSTGEKRQLPNGLIIEDTINGNATAPTAKSGKRVQVRYVGRLGNGKEFDSNTKGSPFSFVLGRGEVISGWDLGVQGMRVGGERKLIIPPKLAYGNQKQPGIPANSTLHFDIKLLAIK